MFRHRFHSLFSHPRQTAHRKPEFRPTLEGLEERTLLTAGTLDPTFNTTGKQHFSFSVGTTHFDVGKAVAVDSLGRIVVAGSSIDATGNTDFAVARLTPNGTLDKSFSGDGLQTIPFNFGGTNIDIANAVAIDAQGRIVLAGSVARDNNDIDFGIVRLKDNGDLDPNFIAGGKRTIALNFGGNNQDIANAVAIDTQGRIVVAGSTQIGADTDFGFTRLDPNGEVDKTFSPDGRRQIEFDLGGSNLDAANAVTFDKEGRIILAGFADTANHGFDFAVARLTATGAIDKSFDGDGKQTIDFNLGADNSDVAQAVAVDGADRIVLAGFVQRLTPGDIDFGVARLTDKGALDKSFNGDGLRTIAFDLGGNDADSAHGVAIQRDGKIVVAGFAQMGATNSDFAVARLNADGTPDGGFDGDGRQTVTFNVGASNDKGNAVALSPDGSRVVVAGKVDVGASNLYFGVAVLDTGLPPIAPVPPPQPVPPVAPVLQSVLINGGAKERSKVSSLTLTFNTIVNVKAAAFAVVQKGKLVPVTLQASIVNGHTVVQLTFPKLKGGSLADGTFTLVVKGNQLTDLAGQVVDADHDGKPGGTKVVTSFRLFGDVNGNGKVDASDKAVFLQALGSKVGKKKFRSFLDFDGNGKINATDKAQFFARFGSSVK